MPVYWSLLLRRQAAVSNPLRANANHFSPSLICINQKLFVQAKLCSLLFVYHGPESHLLEHPIEVSGPWCLDELYQAVLRLVLCDAFGFLRYIGHLVVRLEYECQNNENTHCAGHEENLWDSGMHAALYFLEQSVHHDACGYTTTLALEH
jgi:hypothetical protein